MRIMCSSQVWLKQQEYNLSVSQTDQTQSVWSVGALTERRASADKISEFQRWLNERHR